MNKMEEVKFIEKIKISYIKNLIENLEISNKCFAEEINLSEYYFHELINGKKKFSDAIFNRICSTYSISFNDDPSILIETKQLLEHLIFDIISDNDEDFEDTYKSYLTKQPIIEQSIGFYMISFFQLIRRIGDYECFKNEKLLNKCYSYYSLFDNKVAYSYLIMFLWCNQIPKDLKMMKFMFAKIEHDFSAVDLPDYYKGILSFHKGRLTQKSGNYVESIFSYETAANYLRINYLHSRVLQCEIQLASLNIEIGRYKMAEKMYMNLLHECKSNNFKVRYTTCLNNLAYLSVLMRKYDEAIEYIKDASEALQDNYHLIEYEILAKYCLHTLTISNKDLEELMKLSNLNQYSKKLIQLIYLLNYQGNDADIEKCFNYIYSYCINNNEPIELKLILPILIDYYQERNINLYIHFVNKYINLTSFDNRND